MRRSFGPGMGSGGGGGGSGGGMMKTVHRAVRAGIGGGTYQEPYSHSATTTTRSTTSTNRNPPINTTLSLSSAVNPSSPCSNYLNHPLPAPPNWAFSSSPTASEDDQFDWECIDGTGSDDGGVLYDDFVFGSVPSKDEVYHAVSSLQEVLDPIIDNRRTFGTYDDGIEKILNPTTFYESRTELDWTEPSLVLRNSKSRLHDVRSTRVYDAFQLLQTEPSVQKMVISLSSDKAVWDAVMNNEVVRELRELVNDEDKSISESSEDSVDGANPVTQVLRWMFVNTKEKAIEMVERITKLVNEFVRPTSKNDQKPKMDTDAGHKSFEYKLRSSFLLSIMVLLVVVVSRARKC